MQKIIFILILCSLLSCVDDSKPTIATNDLTAETIFEKSLKAHGQESFENNLISYDIQNTTFTQLTNHGRAILSQTRTKDGQKHKATYDGGFVQYYIDDVLQDESTYPGEMIKRSLYGFLYTTYIPFTLNTNDAHLVRLKDVKIRSKNSYALSINFEQTESTPSDQFILYINKDNFHVEFIALRHSLTSNVAQFRRMIKPRKVNNILFQDYIIFTSIEEDLPLNQLYQKYISAELKDVRTIALENIEVIEKH